MIAVSGEVRIGPKCVCGHQEVDHWASVPGSSPGSFQVVLDSCCLCCCPFFARAATAPQMVGLVVAVLGLDSVVALVVWRLLGLIG